MAVEWLVLWGAGKAIGALAKPVLEDMAKDIAKDQGKSLFGKALKRAAKLIPHDEFLKLYGKAIKELVEVIDEELQNAGITADNIDVWAKDLKQFVRTETIREALPNAFSSSAGIVEGYELKRGWPAETPLPPDFDWDFVAKTFNRKLKKLREDDPDFRAVLQAQAAAETAANTKQVLGVQPDFQLRNYRAALLERYANLHFDMMDTSGANYDGVKLWKVFVPQTVRESREYLPQLHEIPKEHLRRMVASGELDAKDAAMVREMTKELIEERQRAYLDQSPRSVLELASDDRLMRMVVLGDPGAGKSSFLQHLALEWARNENSAEREAMPLPLLIDLKEYDRWDCPNGKSFVRYLHDASTWHRLDQVKLDERLKAAKQPTVLLLDGLDEVFKLEDRTKIINDIHYFSNHYREVRVIVTSRIIGYKPQRLADAEFSHFILQDLDEVQVNDFLDRWHDTTFKNASDAATKKARLARAISDSPAIRELAGNPLLLTMMAILNRNQELPRERIQLYEQASRLLLHQWDTERALISHPQLKGHITAKEKAEMLREIAYAMQSAPEGLAGNLINEDELETMLSRYLKDELGFNQPRAAARDLIEQLRLRNFILCYRGGGSYSFVHRTFLEYFCATAIYQRFVQKLDMNYLLDEIFAPHWQDEKWHEVLCLVSGQVAEKSVEQAAQIIKFLLHQQDETFEFQQIFLAVRCCQELRTPRTLSITFDALRDAVETVLRFDFPYFYERHEPEREQRNRLHDKAVKAMINAQLLEHPLDWLMNRAMKDDHGALRRSAVQELGRGWRDNPNTLQLLKYLAQNDESEWVRKVAVQELARGWHDAPETLLWLKTQAAEGDSLLGIRRAAIQEIARGWRGDSDIFYWLQDCAKNSGFSDVRRAAVQELSRYWKNNHDILILLKDRALKDDDSSVRQASVKELGRYWKDNPDVLLLLKQLAKSDGNVTVRQAAIKELARNWKENSEFFVFIKDCATTDDSGVVRQTAVQEIARGWKNLPDTLPWLMEVATNDVLQEIEIYIQQKFVYVSPARQAAMHEIALGWREVPEIFPWLQNFAAKNNSEGARRAALQELTTGWKDHPHILNLLTNYAINDDQWAVREAALRELARSWKYDSDTLPLLTNRLFDDDDWLVRLTAAKELARGWKNHPNTLSLLNKHLANEESAWARQGLLRVIARGWKENPDSFFLLKASATESDWRVRKAAIHELALGWKDHSDTLPLLKDRAMNDSSPEPNEKDYQFDSPVRLTSMEAIARGWPDNPDTLTLLREREKNDPTPWLREKAKQMADKLEARGMTPLPGVKP